MTKHLIKEGKENVLVYKKGPIAGALKKIIKKRIKRNNRQINYTNNS